MSLFNIAPTLHLFFQFETLVFLVGLSSGVTNQKICPGTADGIGADHFLALDFSPLGIIHNHRLTRSNVRCSEPSYSSAGARDEWKGVFAVVIVSRLSTIIKV
jgi:hypothetical protein